MGKPKNKPPVQAIKPTTTAQHGQVNDLLCTKEYLELSNKVASEQLLKVGFIVSADAVSSRRKKLLASNAIALPTKIQPDTDDVQITTGIIDGSITEAITPDFANEVSGTITVVIGGETTTCSNKSPNYKQAKQAYDKKDWATFVSLSNKPNTRTDVTLVPGVTLRADGNIVVDGIQISEEIREWVVGLAAKAKLRSSMFEFVRGIRRNPDPQVQKTLWNFLRHTGIQLTSDGGFLAYKAVGADFASLHSNPDGSKVYWPLYGMVSMPREDCDPNPNNTCSRGLHVGGLNYVSNHYNTGKLLLIKVMPEDVVAVPTDYNGEKMRVCKAMPVRVMDKPLALSDDLYDTSYGEAIRVAVEDIAEVDAITNSDNKPFSVYESSLEFRDDWDSALDVNNNMFELVSNSLEIGEGLKWYYYDFQEEVCLYVTEKTWATFNVSLDALTEKEFDKLYEFVTEFAETDSKLKALLAKKGMSGFATVQEALLAGFAVELQSDIANVQVEPIAVIDRGMFDYIAESNELSMSNRILRIRHAA